MTVGSDFEFYFAEHCIVKPKVSIYALHCDVDESVKG